VIRFPPNNFSLLVLFFLLLQWNSFSPTSGCSCTAVFHSWQWNYLHSGTSWM